jgi:hypothetical protein
MVNVVLIPSPWTPKAKKEATSMPEVSDRLTFFDTASVPRQKTSREAMAITFFMCNSPVRIHGARSITQNKLDFAGFRWWPGACRQAVFLSNF